MMGNVHKPSSLILSIVLQFFLYGCEFDVSFERKNIGWVYKMYFIAVHYHQHLAYDCLLFYFLLD
jgi:hypothetical protein